MYSVQYRGTEVQCRGTEVQYMYYHVQRSGDTHLLALHSNNG